MFVKLGIRYAVVVDERGLYRGVIEKNRYLHYLRWLEKRAHGRPASPLGATRRDEEEDAQQDEQSAARSRARE